MVNSLYWPPSTCKQKLYYLINVTQWVPWTAKLLINPFKRIISTVTHFEFIILHLFVLSDKILVTRLFDQKILRVMY
jgi:hypothetical protein